MASDQTVKLLLEGDNTDLKRALNDSAKAMDDLAGTGRDVGADIDKVLHGIGEAGEGVESTIRGIDARLDQLTGADREVFLKANIGQAEAALRQIDQMLTDPTLTDAEITLTLDKRNQVAAQVEKLKGDLGELEQAVQDVGSEGERSFGALAGAIGSAGAASRIDEAVTSSGRLQAQLGLTADEARHFDAVATEVYRDNFGDSMGEAAQVTGHVHQSLRLVGDELRAGTEGVFAIRDAFDHLGADVDTTLNATRTLSANFENLDPDDALDLIARGFQSGAGSAGDLLDVLQEYPGDFARIGLNAEDMVGILNAGLDSGAWNADRVGDAVREMGIRISTAGDLGQEAVLGMFPEAEANRIIDDFNRGGAAGREAFFTIIDAIAQTEDPNERYNAQVAIMGTLGEELANQFPEFAEAIRGVGEGADVAGTGVEGLNSQYDGFRNTLDGLLRTLETSVVGTLGDVGLGFADVASNVGIAVLGFKGMRDVMPGMNLGLKGAAIGLAGVTGAVGGILLVKEGLDALGLSAQGLEVDIAGAARATTAELVDAFRELDDFDSGAAMQMFGEIAEGNIGTAQRLRDGLAAVGVETAELDAVLEGAAGAERQMAADAERAAGVLGEAGGQIEDEAIDPLLALEEAIRGVNDALHAQFDPLFAAQDALLSNADAQRRVTEAEWKLTEAQDKLNDAIDKHGPKSMEAAAASQELMRAQQDFDGANRDATRSALDVTTATNNLAAQMRAGNVDIEAAEAQLRLWVQQGLITEDQAWQTSQELRGVGDRAAELEGRNIVIPVDADTSGFLNKITGLYQDRYGEISVRVTGGHIIRHGGGSVPGVSGQEVDVRALAGEYVIRAPAAQALGYDQLERLNRADQMPAMLSGSAVAAPVAAAASGARIHASYRIVAGTVREGLDEARAHHRRIELAHI